MNKLLWASVKDPKAVMDKVRELGLMKVSPNQYYKLFKTGEKVKSSRGYPETMQAGQGFVQLLGDKEGVALIISDRDSWFRTSYILKFKPIQNGFEFETMNSFYRLIKRA